MTVSPAMLIPPLGCLVSSIGLSNREAMTTGDAVFEVAALWYYTGIFFWFVLQPATLWAVITNPRGDPKVRAWWRCCAVAWCRVSAVGGCRDSSVSCVRWACPL
jgi:hypothetical protein